VSARMLPVLQGFTEQDRPDSSIIQSCVRCGLCLPHCPTYLETLRETSSPRGRIHLIEAVAEGRLSLTSPGFVRQMYQCLDCRACEAVCPSGVQYGQLVEAARAQIERARPRPLRQRLLRWLVFRHLFASMRLFRAISSALGLYQRLGLQWLARRSGVLRLLKLAEAEALLPAMPERFLCPQNQVMPPAVSPLSTSTDAASHVALFAGCMMSTAFAETDRATMRVLAAQGCAVHLPAGQGCCGALTVHAGELDQARVLARRTIEAFERWQTSIPQPHLPVEAIIVNAAGCGATLKEYGHLLRDDPNFAERAVAFSARVKDISEYLGDLAGRGELNTAMRPLNLTVTYQDPCHLAHAQHITQHPRQLLQMIPGVRLVEMREPALCCGSAGIYNLTQPEMSRRLLRRKVEHLLETQAEVVVSANPGCILQLQAGLRVAGSSMRVLHLVDLLDAAYQSGSSPG
jgi:glycolate oxidase iron-sulfur subunit